MIPRHRQIGDCNPKAYNRFSIAVILLLSAILMLRQLHSSSYFTVVIDDAFIYPSWAWQFSEALKEGTLYPRWLPLDFWGYGSPTFILYPPLAYYLVALVNLFTGSIIAAMNLVKFASLFLCGVGVYFLVKEFYPSRVALLSAIFSIILPFNIALMYIFGSFAATVSCVWFAPILFFVHRHLKTGSYRHLIFSGVCYCGLILTHLIIAYMFAFVIAAFALYMAVVRKRGRDIVIIPSVILTGLSLAAAYLLPVVFEKKFLNLETFVADSNAIIYSNMFILPDMTARFSQRYFWPIYYSTMVLHTAVFCIFILVIVVARRFEQRVSERNEATDMVERFFLMTAFCSTLLMFGFSSFVWKSVPFFKYILFPARWLHVTAFAASFLSAAVFAHLYANKRPNMGAIISTTLLFLSLIAWDFHYVTGAPGFEEKELFPAIAVNSIMEHLPKGVDIKKIDNRSDSVKGAGFTVQGEGSARVISWKSAERVLEIKAKKPVVMRLRTFNFPGWRARLDGSQVAISTETGTHAIMVNVPKGDHRLELSFEDTPVRRYGKLISIVSLMMLTVYLVMNQLKECRF